MKCISYVKEEERQVGRRWLLKNQFTRTFVKPIGYVLSVITLPIQAGPKLVDTHKLSLVTCSCNYSCVTNSCILIYEASKCHLRPLQILHLEKVVSPQPFQDSLMIIFKWVMWYLGVSIFPFGCNEVCGLGGLGI